MADAPGELRWDLTGQTEKKLEKLSGQKLRDECMRRKIEAKGRQGPYCVQALLDWKEETKKLTAQNLKELGLPQLRGACAKRGIEISDAARKSTCIGKLLEWKEGPKAAARPASNGKRKTQPPKSETVAKTKEEKGAKKPKKVNDDRWEPSLGWPKREDQLASYCGNIPELISYAKGKHGANGGMSTTQVQNWLKKNPDFIPSWLRGADVEIAVDHILSDNWGGQPWPYNYFLMPKADNSHFGSNVEADKKKYVGNHASQTASSFARWARKKVRATASIDYSTFDPVGAQY
tara:strand:+ start:117 stop:989 length:873 start_codon:yes stop_codon:yes gene_type:complete